MKFTKFKKNIISYMAIETNSDITSLIGDFLSHDVRRNDNYLKWLYWPDIISYGGNFAYMELESSKISLIPNWSMFYEDDEEISPRDLEIKFETSIEEMIEILKKWADVINRKPIPQNIAIIQDQNKRINIEIIGEDDVRFSRLIEDKENRLYARLKKSYIFETYFKVEANNEEYLILGILLSSYSMSKIQISQWLDREEEWGKCYSGNIGSFYKDNNIIYISGQPNVKTQKIDWHFQMTKENLINLINQWEDILKSDKFSKDVLIYKQDEKIILETVPNPDFQIFDDFNDAYLPNTFNLR